MIDNVLRQCLKVAILFADHAILWHCTRLGIIQTTHKWAWPGSRDPF